MNVRKYMYVCVWIFCELEPWGGMHYRYGAPYLCMYVCMYAVYINDMYVCVWMFFIYYLSCCFEMFFSMVDGTK